MLKRFVTYIYHYDRGTRGQNVGFIKADIRDAGCRLELQLRGLDRVQGKGKVFLIVSGARAIGIHAGEIALHQGMGQLKLAYARNQLGASGYSVTQIQAIVILCGNRVLVSCWAEQLPEAVLLGKFDVWSETAPLYEANDSIPSDAAPNSDISTDDAPNSDISTDGTTDNNVSADDTKDVDIPARSSADDSSSADETKDVDIPAHSSTDDSSSADDAAIERSADNAANDSDSSSDAATAAFADDDTADDNDAPTVGIADAPTSPDETLISFDIADEANRETTPQAAEPAIRYERISIADIRQSLPKSNWYLCSNSFLIHGFFNYHYLMLKTVEQNGQKKCYLGVPGVYERPERTMAFMFGFPSFEPARSGEESDPSSGADVQAASLENGVFGYWMLQLTD